MLDLGLHPWHAKVPFVARFVNSSAGGLTIAGVKTSCGCIGVETESYRGMVVPPGNYLEIPGELQLGSAVSVGERIDLLVDSGAVHTATIVAEVFATYRVSAERIDFGRVDLCAPNGELIRTAAFQSEVVQIVECTADAPWVAVGLRELDGQNTEIVAQLLPDKLLSGKNTARIKVVTTDETHPAHAIVVGVEATLSLRPVPSYVILAPDQPSAVSFFDADGNSARLVSHRNEAQGVQAAISPDGGRLLLRASETTAARKGGTIWVVDETGRHSRVLVSELAFRS